jgi:hypothetical protein
MLDKLPFATLQALIVDAVAIYCVVADKVPIHSATDLLEFLAGLGIIHGGTAAIGYVRNQAGKGQRGDL